MAYTSPQNPCQNSVQLQITKANQLIISGTRFFGKNLMMDLKPDSQKELKNVGSMLFPHFLATPKFWAKFSVYITCRISGLRLWQPQDAWFLVGKKFPWFSFKPCIDWETGNHFQKNFKPKKSKFDPKKHQNHNFYPKMKNGPWQCILCSIQPAAHFKFLSMRIRHFGEHSGVL